MPRVGWGVRVGGSGLPPAGCVNATRVNCTAVLTALTVAWTSVPPPPQARPAAASSPSAHSGAALIFVPFVIGHTGLFDADYLAMVVHDDAEAEHAQIGARLGGQALVQQLGEVLIHVFER